MIRMDFVTKVPEIAGIQCHILPVSVPVRIDSASLHIGIPADDLPVFFCQCTGHRATPAACFQNRCAVRYGKGAHKIRSQA